VDYNKGISILQAKSAMQLKLQFSQLATTPQISNGEKSSKESHNL
jgi:hypothetical protein